MCTSIVENKNKMIVCPVVSMVYDVTDRTVYWCENREWDKKVRKRKCFGESLIE